MYDLVYMPSRNLVRTDISESYYHVYLRGVNRFNVFLSDDEKEYFLYLLGRHLSVKPVTTKNGYKYPHYRDGVELVTYCVMDNHFHLLLFQLEVGTMTRLMQSVLNAFNAYYRSKHDWRGPLFESRFKASRIDTESYLLHVSRYIHLNPRSWKKYKYSSFHHIEAGSEPEWLETTKLLELHASRKSYKKFVSDYEDNKKMLAEIKHELADL